MIWIIDLIGERLEAILVEKGHMWSNNLLILMSFSKIALVKSFSLKKAQKLLPQRKKTDHKKSVGSILIVAGSKGMFGAAVLCAQGASRSGSSYVQLATEAGKFPIYKHPDFLIHDYSEIPKLKFDSLAIGPGMGTSSQVVKLLNRIIKLKNIPIVLDADALNLLSKNKQNKTLDSNFVLTPHEGEMARLLKVDSKKVASNRLWAALEAQKRFQCVVVLKGHATLVCDAKRVYRIESGNPALAKAGTGDVLTGMICAFQSQGLPSFEAACLGCFVHGYVADKWIKSKKDVLSFMASDLVELLPEVLFEIRKDSSKQKA